MGTLSPGEFYIAATELCEKWKASATDLPQWMWIPSQKEEGYLSLENVYYLSYNEDPIGEQEFTDEEELADAATLTQCSHKEPHLYNFHIVYSFSYKVPVLYFRGYQCDGQPLNLDDIEKDLPRNSLNLMKESRWAFMTQEEHPFLHCPWYTLHPCGTSDWMKLLLGDNQQKDTAIVRYLPSWLSVVGQAVGLRIPLNLHAEPVGNSASLTNEDLCLRLSMPNNQAITKEVCEFELLLGNILLIVPIASEGKLNIDGSHSMCTVENKAYHLYPTGRTHFLLKGRLCPLGFFWLILIYSTTIRWRTNTSVWGVNSAIKRWRMVLQ